MRKKLAAVLMTVCVVMAAGCGGTESGESSGNGADTEGRTEADDGSGTHTDENGGTAGADGNSVSDAQDSQGGGTDDSGADAEDGTELLTLRIVDGAETGNLVLAGEGAGEVYTLLLDGLDIFADGTAAMPTMLEDGMLAEIRYTGEIMETFPAQIGNAESISVYTKGTEMNPLGTYFDLCGLYLKVLNDLWDKDSGLNEGAAYVSVDLSEAPGDLTEGEKQAVAWIFAGEHGAEALALGYEELAEQGFLAEYEFGEDGHKLYEWTDGVLFSITGVESAGKEVYTLPVLKFRAEKWRSPLGAYFLEDCKAVWSEIGYWSDYSIGAEAIS